MIRRLTKGSFEEQYKATVGIDYSQMKMILNSINILFNYKTELERSNYYGNSNSKTSYW